MRREAIALGAMAVAALLAGAGCATNPKTTVANLDSTDRRWNTRQCIAARKAVYKFNDHHNLHTVLGVAGDLVVPFAGAGADLAMSSGQQHERERLNDWVLSACVSDRKKALEMEDKNRHRIIAAVQG
jgi:hypothetical protein